MPQPSEGGSSYTDPATAFGGADAVPETPDVSPRGAGLEGEGASSREHGVMAMRETIRAGRYGVVLLALIFMVGLAGWVFYFLYWE